LTIVTLIGFELLSICCMAFDINSSEVRRLKRTNKHIYHTSKQSEFYKMDMCTSLHISLTFTQGELSLFPYCT